MAADTAFQGLEGQVLIYMIDGDGVPQPVGALHALPVDLVGVETVTLTASAVTADTELPPAAALADGAANPTTPTVGVALSGFNGTTWDRLRASIANGLLADIARIKAPTSVVHGAIAPTNAAALALAAYTTRAAVTFYNEGTVKVYLGIDNTLTTANGYPLPVGGSHTVEADVAVWMITASGTGDVRYWSERY